MSTKKRAPKKAATKKKATSKKKASKKATPTAKRTGRPRTDPLKVAAAVAAVIGGDTVADAARAAGVSVRVLYRALEAAGAEPPAKRKGDADEEEDLPELNPDASSLEIAKALLDRTMLTIKKLPCDSPRMNPAHANARAYLKLYDSLQRAEVGDETPEQAEARKRREDGDVRKMLLRYVEEYEAQAARDGVCLHCGQPVQKAAEVTG